MFQECMHVRNPYSKPPDFKQLAEEFEEFNEYVTCQRNGKYRVDFKDPAALRALTKVLLKKDFSLEIEIPENSIIPTVPQRLNYLLWMEDLFEKLPKRSQDVKGIDIGTGASCIFPLLGFRKNRWRFVATEIDEDSRKCAEQNLKQNKLEDYITIKKVSKETIFKEIFEDCDEVFDFCFCNPPFFDDYDDQRKQKLPHCPKPLEVIVDGGEVSFVKRMIDDSLSFREKIRIYSSMLGKKKSMKVIVNFLKNIKGVTYTTTSFCQGNTMRWGIAWTYLQIPNFNIETPKKKKKKEKRPLSFMVSDEDISLKKLLQRIKSILVDFQIAHRDIHVSKTKASLKIKSYKNTWTGQRRKRRELKRKMEGTSPVKYEKEELQLKRSLCNLSPEIPLSTENQKRKMGEVDSHVGDTVLPKHTKKDCVPSTSTSCDSLSSHTEQDSSASHEKQDSSTSHENQDSSTSHEKQDFSTDSCEKSILNCQKRKIGQVDDDTVTPKRGKKDYAPSTSTSCDLSSSPMQQDLSASHREHDSSASHEKQDSSTSHEKQDSSTSHEKQDSSAAHEKQDSSTSHEKRDSSTSHEKQDFSTDSSEKSILNCQKRKIDQVDYDTVTPKRGKKNYAPSTSASCDLSSSPTEQDSSASHREQDSSAAHEKQDSSTDSSERPILNCQIHLTKVESKFIFQLSSDFTSNLEVMHQVFQLFHNKLNPRLL